LEDGPSPDPGEKGQVISSPLLQGPGTRLLVALRRPHTAREGRAPAQFTPNARRRGFLARIPSDSLPNLIAQIGLCANSVTGGIDARSMSHEPFIYGRQAPAYSACDAQAHAERPLLAISSTNLMLHADGRKAAEPISIFPCLF